MTWGRFLNGEPILARRISPVEKLTHWIRRYPVVSALSSLVVLLAFFALGGLLQYANVVEQRDRATIAELQAQQLLANEAANSGELAFRRGQTQQAVKHFQNALSRGISDVERVELRLAESEIINGNFGLAVSHVKSVAQEVYPDKTRLIQCQLALLGEDEFGTAEQLLESIDLENLELADRHYVLGLRSSTSLQAFEHFKLALEHDTYHHAARRASLVVALSLADFDYVLDVVKTSRQLFPDDDDFRLFEALAWAARGSQSHADAQIALTKLTETEKQAWREFADFLYELCQMRDLAQRNEEFTYKEMTELLLTFELKYAPLVSQRQWFFPPEVQTKFADYLKHISQFKDPLWAANPFSEVELVLASAHSESTLNTLIARRMLTHRGTEMDSLLKVQQLYETALETHGFIRDARWQAQMGAFAAAIFLTQMYQHDVEQNTKRTLEILEELPPATIGNLRQLRLMTIFAINQQRWDLASKFAARWLGLARQGDDKQVLQDALWHQAVVFKNQKKWYRTICICNELLEEISHLAQDGKPRSKLPVLPLRGFAVLHLKQAVDFVISASVFSQIMEATLAEENWDVSDNVLAQWKAIVKGEPDPRMVLYGQISQAGREKNWSEVTRLLNKFELREGVLAPNFMRLREKVKSHLQGKGVNQ